MDLPAKVRNFFEPALGLARAICCNAAKIPGRLSPSFFVARRPINQLAFLGIFLRGFHQPIQLSAGFGVALHLAVPIVVRPGMEQRLQLATLLRREAVNRGLDFSHRAHAGKLSPRRRGVNEPKPNFVQRRGRDIFIETKIKMFLAPSGAAYCGEMIFRRCRSDGAFRNRGNFLQRFRSWRSLNTRKLRTRLNIPCFTGKCTFKFLTSVGLTVSSKTDISQIVPARLRPVREFCRNIRF